MSRGSVVLGCLLTGGCPANDTTPASTDGLSTSGADATSDGTTTPTTSSAVAETSSSTTTSGSGSSGSVTFGSSSGTGCPCGFTQIGPEEETPDGYSFADQVQELADVDVPFVWSGVLGDPTTIVHLHLELVPETARYGTGCGICVGVNGRVRVVVDSDDGFLAERTRAGLAVVPGDQARLDVVAKSFEQFRGTLPELPLDEPYELAGIAVEWDLSAPDSPPYVVVYVPLGGGIAVLGESIAR